MRTDQFNTRNNSAEVLVTSKYLEAPINILVSAGFDKSVILNYFGLKEKDFASLGCLIPFSIIAEGAFLIRKTPGFDQGGLAYGGQLSPTLHGAIGISMMSQQNFSDAIDLFLQYSENFITNTKILRIEEKD